ncbi:hypothetical protein [Pseudonocardia alni]|uniref:hypothetical protein n=1 Tax=Pseudonocardia alni TaxID=33907 RepID=UPI00332EDE0D
MTAPRPWSNGQRTLLEARLPVGPVSRLVAADRRARDPIYLAHRWFARRPPALLRAILLASVLPSTTPEAEFWRLFADGNSDPLKDKTVYDPFHGGGTTLIEAGRLGAHVAGRDIDPVACRLVRHELRALDLDEFDASAEALLDYLGHRFSSFYPTSTEAQPLHYFSVARVECPTCSTEDLLYRNLLLARGVKRNGSVARPPEQNVFCPQCARPKQLPLDAKEFHCCGKALTINAGTWERNRWTCPECHGRFSHLELRTGVADRQIVGIEETSTTSSRFIRAATDDDLLAHQKATEYITENFDALTLPEGSVESDGRDSRPASFGIEQFRDMFTHRQLAVFGSAFSFVRKLAVSEPVRDGLILAVSNALTSNNRMCGYATDYGRLSALFSVRGYSLPILSVELNPLHPTAGRGTLARTIQRVRASTRTTVRRYVWDTTRDYPKAVVHEHRRDTNPTLVAGSATAVDSTVSSSRTADLVITDPPYFDYISYDRLSAFYRSWFDEDSVSGDPILPDEANPRHSFGIRLGAALTESASALKDGGLLAFTYHSSSRPAWEALGLALDEAKLRVTALWPVLADPHMGHHGTSGACQYDIVVVTRPVSQLEPAEPPFGIDGGAEWIDSLPLDLPKPDRIGALLAYETLGSRWATVEPAQDSESDLARPTAPGE